MLRLCLVRAELGALDVLGLESAVSYSYEIDRVIFFGSKWEEFRLSRSGLPDIFKLQISNSHPFHKGKNQQIKWIKYYLLTGSSLTQS
jgi:hypothetical protein